MTDSPLDRFQKALSGPDILERLRDGLIGKGVSVPGPFGDKPLVYCDYTASGRALRQIDDFVMTEVLPFYANSHTEASYCGARMTVMRREARALIARVCGAGPEHAVIFSRSGATAGLNRLVHLFGIPKALAEGKKPVVLIGPYEHHSNILPWRESGAEVVTVAEAAEGGPCMASLDAALAAAAGRPIVGAFSAASNVTGRRSDIAAVTRKLKAAGAKVVWDYAAGGPYLPIAMTPEAGAEIDAVVVSPHKFVGGPGTSGVMVVRRDAVVSDKPTWAGGGTVRFVSPTSHDYIEALESREEAGTPNVVGDIRAALVFAVKQAVGTGVILQRGAELRDRALAVWRKDPRIEILGAPAPDSLAIVSFRVRDGAGGLVHHQFVTRLLSDMHGVQARGGCACAGPYVHSLLGIGAEESERLRAAILAGQESEKPGFVRLNFSYLMSDAEADAVIAAVSDVAARASEMAARYDIDIARAIFRARPCADAA
jgi:selenocysteine lyase/cysteine desulfurase